jgi:hypothetical protein
MNEAFACIQQRSILGGCPDGTTVRSRRIGRSISKRNISHDASIQKTEKYALSNPTGSIKTSTGWLIGKGTYATLFLRYIAEVGRRKP